MFCAIIISFSMKNFESKSIVKMMFHKAISYVFMSVNGHAYAGAHVCPGVFLCWDTKVNIRCPYHIV